jgi:uncharacterized protein
MLSLQSYFSNSSSFSRLFEACAAEIRGSADMLLEQLDFRWSQANEDAFAPIRQRYERLDEEIATLLCQSFNTPLEREDLEALSSALSAIQKAMEKLSTRLLMSRPFLPIGCFDLPAKTLKEITNLVCEMVEGLWRQPDLPQFKAKNDRLHLLENDADKLVVAMLSDLYRGESEMMQVVILRDLFELLEQVIDHCREAGNVIFHILLKNS